MSTFHHANHQEKSNKALFLDRDGVLIEYIPYLSHPQQVRIPVDGGETLKIWQRAGYKLIVITNQSGVGRGYFSLNDVEAVHSKMRTEYERFDVQFHDIFVCPHLPSDKCQCRKPSPQMVIAAAAKYNINIEESFFIGDAISDVECALNAGCKPIFLYTDRTELMAKDFIKNQPSISIVHEIKETLKLIVPV